MEDDKRLEAMLYETLAHKHRMGAYTKLRVQHALEAAQQRRAARLLVMAQVALCLLTLCALVALALWAPRTLLVVWAVGFVATGVVAVAMLWHVTREEIKGGRIV